MQSHTFLHLVWYDTLQTHIWQRRIIIVGRWTLLSLTHRPINRLNNEVEGEGGEGHAEDNKKKASKIEANPGTAL